MFNDGEQNWLIMVNIWLVVTGTMEFDDFPYIGNFIIPTDELILFRGVGIPPTSSCFGGFWPWKPGIWPVLGDFDQQFAIENGDFDHHLQLNWPFFTCWFSSSQSVRLPEAKHVDFDHTRDVQRDVSPITLWLCQNSYWTWPVIVSLPMKNGDFT